MRFLSDMRDLTIYESFSFNEKLCENIRLWRKVRSMSVKNLAKISDIPITQMEAIQWRDKEPTLQQLEKIALALDIKPSQIKPKFQEYKAKTRIDLFRPDDYESMSYERQLVINLQIAKRQTAIWNGRRATFEQISEWSSVPVDAIVRIFGGVRAVTVYELELLAIALCVDFYQLKPEWKLVLPSVEIATLTHV